MAAGGKPHTLSSLLIEKHIIGPEQHARAAERQKELGISFEQALMDLGFLSLDDLTTIYREMLQVHFLKLEDVEIDREAVRHVPAAVAHRHHLIPVRRSGNSLAVAMTDPTDPESLAALRRVTDFDIIPFVSRYDAIEHALYVNYGDPADPAAGDGEAPSGDHLVRSRALLEEERTGHVGKSIQLNRQQSFETFVSDAANEFPVGVARAIAELQSEEIYNPFHCWGPEGCGKSHLLHAIANHVTAHSPLKRCILTTGQRFVDELFQSIRDKKTNFFRYLYRELDLLLLDDGEALLSRDWAQRELLETFRALQKRGRRFVISARRNLATEGRMLPELRVALESGVIAGFAPYSNAAKVEIARKHSGGVELPETVLAELVEASANPCELLNLLQHVTVMSTMEDREITLEGVRDLIQMCGKACQQSAGGRARGLSDAAAPRPQPRQDSL
jgi:chromosomal replication initiation ATPase DnaA